MLKPHFGSIDFYEAVILIDLALIDFDNTYPHVTKHVRDWEEQWKSVEVTQYAKVEGSTITVQLGEETYGFNFVIARPDLLSAVALLINLKNPQSIDRVELVVNNLFQPTEFTITR